MGNCQNDSIIDDVLERREIRFGKIHQLKMFNAVWDKDYQGLFDFDAKDLKRSMLSADANCMFIRQKQQNSLHFSPEMNYTDDILKKALFEIIKRDNYFKVVPIYIENEHYTLQKLLWLVVKTVPKGQYPLKQRDIMKFGKQKIRVREIVHNDPNASALIGSQNIKTSKKIYDDLRIKENHPEVEPNKLVSKEDFVNQIQSIVTENQFTCRICLEPGESINPLICACKCIGSVKYIHLKCLRTWLGKRLNVQKTKNCVTIKWAPLSCEMCKGLYKYRIYLDNKKYYTVQIPKPAKPYIVVEVIKKSLQFSKIFHFMSFAQTSKVSIGRRKDIDLKISDDVSVSRHHANIFYNMELKKFYLEDNKSKFGTLVLIKRNLVINPMQRGISFQMGAEIFIMESIRQSTNEQFMGYKEEENYLNVLEKGVSLESKLQAEESEENQDEEIEEDINQEEVVGSHHNNLNSNLIVNNIEP